MTIPPVLMSPPVLLGGASALLLVGYLIWQASNSAAANAPIGAPAPSPSPPPAPSPFANLALATPFHFSPLTLLQTSGHVGALANAAALQAMGGAL